MYQSLRIRIARPRGWLCVRRRKKRQKNSESDTSRERNVAERSGVKRSGSLLLSLSVFPSLFDRLSLNISQSVSLSPRSLSLSLYLSAQIISRRLPPEFSCTVDRRRGDRPRRESTLLSGGFFFSNPERIAALLLSRARPEERKLPGPNHASAAIFYLRRESGV